MQNKDFATKPAPADWPRLSTALFYKDAAGAIDWLCKVFGFEIRLKIEGEGGSIVHSELEFGRDALIMVAAEESPHRPEARHHRSPASIGGVNTQSVMLFVDDADAHCAHAREHGATIASEPTTSDYGEDYWTDRSYEAVDVEGHHWWFVQRLRSSAPKPQPRPTPTP